MRCEVVAIGTELLLGQIVDTNSAWMGEQLALRGIEHLRQTKVGDNQARMVSVLREALERADAVIVCGGLGPTQDDITREAIAELMGVPLERQRRAGRLHPRPVRPPWPRHAGQQPAPGRRARRRDADRAAHGHGAGAHLPGGGQGDLRRARRALRDARDARASRAARPRATGRRAADLRQPHPAHVGRERVTHRRAARAPHRRPRRHRQPHARLPRQRHRGHQGSAHRPRPTPLPPRTRCWTRRRPRSAPCSAISCSPGATSRWRR